MNRAEISNIGLGGGSVCIRARVYPHLVCEMVPEQPELREGWKSYENSYES